MSATDPQPGWPIREATGEDVSVVAGLRVAFLAEVRNVEPASLPESFSAETHSFLEAESRCGALRSWLAEDDGRAIGVVSLLRYRMPPRPEDPRIHEGYIVNMYVDPRERRRGIGRALFTTCVARAPGLGIRRLFLHATEDGRAMYRTARFETNPDWMELRLPT